MKQIAYVTDIHLDEAFPIEHGVDARKNWNLILEDIASRNMDKIIIGGDIGAGESYSWFFDSIRNFNVHIILGNHDSFPEASEYYKNGFNGSDKELFYSYEDSSLKYIFLDSSSAEISQIQFEWLKGEIKTDKKILLLIHHPVLKIETAIDRLLPLEGRDEIKTVLQESRREIIIMCGHYHTMDERTEGNITQITTSAASYQIKKNTDTIEVINDIFGYRIINIHKDEIDTELMLYKNGHFVLTE